MDQRRQRGHHDELPDHSIGNTERRLIDDAHNLARHTAEICQTHRAEIQQHIQNQVVRMPADTPGVGTDTDFPEGVHAVSEQRLVPNPFNRGAPNARALAEIVVQHLARHTAEKRGRREYGHHHSHGDQHDDHHPLHIVLVMHRVKQQCNRQRRPRGSAVTEQDAPQIGKQDHQIPDRMSALKAIQRHDDKQFQHIPVIVGVEKDR